MNIIEKTMNSLKEADKEKIMRNISRPFVLIKNTPTGIRAILTIKNTCTKKELIFDANVCKRSLLDLDYKLPKWRENTLTAHERDLTKVNKIVELICGLETPGKEFIDSILLTILTKFEN